MPLFRQRNPELPPTAGLPARWADVFRRPAVPFLRGLAEQLGLPEPLATCSGTAAQMIALTALHRRAPRRSEVILPAYTCPLTALAVKRAGLRTVVCDTRPGGFDFDPHGLNALCSERTLAVMPTHLGGRVADLDAALAAAGSCGAAVLEDAAQALGARRDGISAGLRGDAGFFSLAAGKGLTTYEGGVLFSRDPALRAELREIAARMLRPDLCRNARRFVELCGYIYFYAPHRLWRVYGRPLAKALDRGDEEAAVGDVFGEDIPLHSLDRLRLRMAANALPRLSGHLAGGRERAAARLPLLRELPGVTVLEDGPETEGVWPFFILLMPGREQRDRALQTLWRSGTGVSRLFIRALPDYAYLRPGLDVTPPCPNARDFSERMLTISNTPWLEDSVFQRIVNTLRRAL